MRDARAINALAYETRVGSPLDFQPKRVSAPSCFRARCATLKQAVAPTREKLRTFGVIDKAMPNRSIKKHL